jgi:NDP-sugar pyrophosphorylase family protein
MSAPLRAAIIAAGEGSRLRESHPGVVKPLVPVAGRPLCHWVASALSGAGVRDITVLLNSNGTQARQSLAGAFPAVRWTFLQQDTASSWESFRLVSHHMGRAGTDFMVSAVDSLMPPAETARFARSARDCKAAAALALTSFVDDEKPLWADLSGGRVSALGADAVERRYVTAGLYYLTCGLAAAMPAPQAYGSLRAYLGALVRDRAVAGIPISKTLDVDRPEDIAQAEAFVQWPIA